MLSAAFLIAGHQPIDAKNYLALQSRRHLRSVVAGVVNYKQDANSYCFHQHADTDIVITVIKLATAFNCIVSNGESNSYQGDDGILDCCAAEVADVVDGVCDQSLPYGYRRSSGPFVAGRIVYAAWACAFATRYYILQIQSRVHAIE